MRLDGFFALARVKLATVPQLHRDGGVITWQLLG